MVRARKGREGYLCDHFAPPLDDKAYEILRKLAQRKLSVATSRTAFALIAAFRPWRAAFGRVLREEYKKESRKRKKQ